MSIASDASEKNIVEVRDVSFSYGSVSALEHASLDIHEGHYLGVVGPNGSGKSTLLKIMLGLLRPASGTVRLFGEDIHSFHDWHRIGYVPQKVTNIDARFPATVREVVAMGRYGRLGLFHRMKETDQECVRAALDRVGLIEYENRLIGNLSGGQQQRVFIARALSGEPDILFLDEPMTGVDEKAEDTFYDLLRTLNRDSHMTIVIVSHDIGRIAHEANHIACINRTMTCFTSPEGFLRESEALAFGDGSEHVVRHRYHAT